jgi:hypothetical protein
MIRVRGPVMSAMCGPVMIRVRGPVMSAM